MITGVLIMDKQDVTPAVTIRHKKEIALPLIALGLVLFPALYPVLSPLIGLPGIASLLTILSPVAGLILGVISLSRGKGRISLAGKIIAVIAIVLPLAVIAFILIFFMGAAMGLISLM
jgi:hypothetical protein